MKSPKWREESDTMGTIRVPQEAYWGAHTQRAMVNSSISRIRMPLSFIHGLALIKKHCCLVNMRMERIDEPLGKAIAQAAEEVATGGFDDQFPVDVFQTGSGTSSNMNMNEVLAGRANELLTGHRGGKHPVHPNDHVNMGQSSNDVMPTALHLTAAGAVRSDLLPALETLEKAFSGKVQAFAHIRKIGRTHLQDAVPMSLGEEFSAFKRQVSLAMDRIRSCEPRLFELALGGTAVGSGINTPKAFPGQVITAISQEMGIDFVEAPNHFEAQACRDTAVELSGHLKTCAVSLAKIANDIRMLGSGPRCGIGEIRIPDLQPGSSIMPGKVNPIIPEIVIQAAVQVAGNDTAISMGGMWGQFQLNTMIPLICHNLLGSIQILAGAARDLASKCVAGIEADEARCAAAVESSLALATVLVPRLGYDQSAIIAKKAYESGKTIRQMVLDTGVMPISDYDALAAES
jgi:fumarate hydratase, class II